MCNANEIDELKTYEKTYRYEKGIPAKERISRLELIKEYDNLEKLYVKKFNNWVIGVYADIVSELKK